MKKKIFVCGGHVTPAIALIDEFAGDPSVELVFVGRTYAAEYNLITEKGIRFLSLRAGKRSWSMLTKIPIGFIQAFGYCIREKPNLIVSFGGYVALPVAIAGWILRIGVITHEQTLMPGLANRIIAKVAKRVCVTHKQTLGYFPKGKTILTGLPLRKEIYSPSKKPAYRIDENNYPLIYITGGSQGAKSLNEKIFPAVIRLTKSYTVIHQTGSASYKSALRYIVEPYISLTKLSWILNHAMFVIGRSGANTTMELAALGKVAILIPLPWSAGNEQLLLARWLASGGGAEVITQDTLSAETLITCMKKVRDAYDTYSKRAIDFSDTIPRDGAKRLALEVRRLCS